MKSESRSRVKGQGSGVRDESRLILGTTSWSMSQGRAALFPDLFVALSQGLATPWCTNGNRDEKKGKKKKDPFQFSFQDLLICFSFLLSTGHSVTATAKCQIIRFHRTVILRRSILVQIRFD